MRRAERAPSGEAAFEVHFQEIYGDRWPTLKTALQTRERQVARANSFAGGMTDLRWVDPERPVIPERTAAGLLDVYILDPASIVAARALQACPGDRVLDLCAAPGGKTLILAEALAANGAFDGELVANEPSADRRERLTKVIQQYVPRGARDSVFVRGLDGVQFGLREPAAYDRILVDAPCSGERHLLANAAELATWGPRRSEHLATRQYALLAAAWLAVRPGGRIVYSTCSISPEENDGVVARLVKKKKTPQVIPGKDLPEEVFAGLREFAIPGEWGVWFLPDRGGIGPIYFAVIEKPVNG